MTLSGRCYIAAQQLLPYEKNWANEVLPLLNSYELSGYEIVGTSKDAWKSRVTHNVTVVAFKHLTSQIKDKTKTKQLSYNTLGFQPYMHQYSHKQACTLFKLRSYSVDCKVNRKSSNNNLTCRLCDCEDESQIHVINCSLVRGDNAVLDISRIFVGDFSGDDKEVVEVCRRVDKFNSLVNVSSNNKMSEGEEV